MQNKITRRHRCTRTGTAQRGRKEVLARMGRKRTPHTLLVGIENEAKKIIIMKKMMQPW